MSIFNQLFDNVSRIGNDNCDLTNKNLQNTQASNYILENYQVYNPINNAFNLATNQPNVFLAGSNGGGINRNNIDENSILKFAHQTKFRERVSEQERLFSTVPYLGKGPSNVVLESQIKTGDYNLNKKSTDPNSEVSHVDYSYYPLIPSIEATISNPANLVEGVAANDWVKGGVPSRILNRDQTN
uniref:Uncharacterized protein n=1 Tax=viral metagenome TaxID=1070528 RepID=A0A6C0AZ80_9ZZZZ|tara:strand:- start:9598 stop:10152 length:555 start_codon:yes stop_codon:yes gene_type:complete